jgi:hypothetical protein
MRDGWEGTRWGNGQAEDVVEDPVGAALLDQLEDLRELERGRVVDLQGAGAVISERQLSPRVLWSVRDVNAR